MYVFGLLPILVANLIWLYMQFYSITCDKFCFYFSSLVPELLTFFLLSNSNIVVFVIQCMSHSKTGSILESLKISKISDVQVSFRHEMKHLSPLTSYLL